MIAELILLGLVGLGMLVGLFVKLAKRRTVRQRNETVIRYLDEHR